MSPSLWLLALKRYCCSDPRACSHIFFASVPKNKSMNDVQLKA